MIKTEIDTPGLINDEEKNLLLAVTLLPPPVAIDRLIGIESLSPVRVLRIMASLVHKGYLAEADDGPGAYQLKKPADQKILTNSYPKDHVATIAVSLIRQLKSSDLSKMQKSLSIANIAAMIGQLQSDEIGDVLSAANYCLEVGAMEAATIYFQLILQSSFVEEMNPQGHELYIDAVLGLISANGHLMPLKHQRKLMLEAAKCARTASSYDKLCLINLRLAQILKTEGDYSNAAILYEEAWTLAKKLNRADLLKQAALFTSDFLFWQGLVSDAVSRYEAVIGDAENFPADQATLRAAATLGWCYGICGQTARGIGLIEVVRNRAKALDLVQVKAYAELMAVLSLIDARRNSEAEAYLDSVFNLPEEVLGNYILWGGYAARAFLLCLKGDLQGCYQFQKKAFSKSREIGWPHHRGPYNFDYMDILEEAGLVHPEMNYNSEIQRLCDWPDVYMQGVGLRYRAQRSFKKNGPEKEILADLEQSSQLLTRAGALLELARTQILIARIKLRTQPDNSSARNLLKNAWRILSSVNPELFPEELRPYLEYNSQEVETIETLFEVSNAIGTVRNRDRLLTRIINLLMRLTCAGRGGVFLVDASQKPKLVASRNLDRSIVESVKFDQSMTLIKSVITNGVEVIQSEESSSAGGWYLCSPVALGEHFFGAIYLDNTLVGILPPKKILSILKLVCNQMAVAIDNANAYEEIERLKIRLENETKFYRMELDCLPESGTIVGKSNALKKVLSRIQKVSKTDSTVLIIGETGVGKELVARSIHRRSDRCNGPFIPVNTASLSHDVIASEFFGHEKGAFTGAVQQRRGRFELADGGTLFLDDIDAISVDVQAKILRAIQEKEFERVGGSKTIKSDFRLIAATNADLRNLIGMGKFRADLFYRLNVFPIQIPPLRERKEDIILLANHFLQVFNLQMNRSVIGFTREQINSLENYPWPGNVRELKHIIERTVILSDGNRLILPELSECNNADLNADNFLTLQAMEKQHILKALEICKGKISGDGGAWQLLGLNASTLYAKMRKLNIKKGNYISN